jgi:DNA repair exonuclease SbcCD ATPase subunit
MSKETSPHIKVTWEDTPENFTQEKLARIKTYFKKKYKTTRVNVVTRSVNTGGIVKNIDASENILDEAFQTTLVKEYLKDHKIDIKWEDFKRLHNKINDKIGSTTTTPQHKKWIIKWIEFDNFLSFGEGNKIDFENSKGITVIDSIPSNFGGKTTVSVDLLLFLFFNTTTKSAKAIEIFNRYTNKNRVLVRGQVQIDGDDYIIERGIVRKKTKKGEWSVSTTLNFSKKLSDNTLQNLEGEQRRETETFIKESIGTVDDFLMTILATGTNLESLIESKPTARGQVLTRYIGLDSLKKKEDTCKQIYSEWSRSLISNLYNKLELTHQIEEFNNSIELCNQEIKEVNKNLVDINDRLQKGQTYKDDLLKRKHTDIDESLMKLDPIELEETITIFTDKVEGKKKEFEEFKVVEPEIFYDKEKHKHVNKVLEGLKYERGVQQGKLEEYKKSQKRIEGGEICGYCGLKLSQVKFNDETQVSLEECEKNIENIDKKIGKNIIEVEKIEISKKQFEKYDRDKLKKVMLELEFEKLNKTLLDKKVVLSNWNKNKERLEQNREIELKLVKAQTRIQTLESEKHGSTLKIKEVENNIQNLKRDIATNEERIKKIEEEERVDKIFKAYLAVYGKNGISKTILKSMVPFINNELGMLLSDSAEFTLVLKMNEKNEVEFWMVDNSSGLEKLMRSGSGYERTVASLALRAVLARVCSLPKPNVVCFDEVYGKVSNENLELIGKFFVKIRDYFEVIIVITHNDLVKEWADKILTIKKDNNISKILSYA